jgi:hypothetical protein
MTSQIEKAEVFRRLHVPHDPLIFYSIRGGRSAKAVERAGAKAIATDVPSPPARAPRRRSARQASQRQREQFRRRSVEVRVSA